MENASKALIIAGSILLSILIIALGMFIFSNSSTTTNSMGSTLSENEKQTFNIKFEKYVGKQTGSSIASLISTVRSTAVANKTSSEMILSIDYDGKHGSSGKDVDVTGGSELDDDAKDGDDVINTSTYLKGLTDITNDLQKSHDYYVALEYNSSGLVSKITITYNPPKDSGTPTPTNP